MANNLKSLEVSEEKAVKREASYKDQIKSLTVKLKQNTAGAEFAERSVQKLQKEVRFRSLIFSMQEQDQNESCYLLLLRLTDWRTL